MRSRVNCEINSPFHNWWFCVHETRLSNQMCRLACMKQPFVQAWDSQHFASWMNQGRLGPQPAGLGQKASKTASQQASRPASPHASRQAGEPGKPDGRRAALRVGGREGRRSRRVSRLVGRRAAGAKAGGPGCGPALVRWRAPGDTGGDGGRRAAPGGARRRRGAPGSDGRVPGPR